MLIWGVHPLFPPLQVSDALDVGFHAGGAGLFHLVGDVAVHVQGERCRCVAQVSLHRFDIVTGADSGHGVAVAQIVKAGVRAADAGHDPLELLRDRPGHQVPADLVGEHVPGGIVP